ncbi:MAG: acyl-CoA dehydrogenase family protein, partial [Acidimicrobiales bacterium]
DEWVVNGQKVWTTGAKTATYAMLLARTDWDAPKHRGITYFVLPMHQPGVEVRPLRQMNGHASFNEVFFTDARVPDDNVVGEVNDGWAAALTTLANERGLGGVRLVATDRWQPGRTAREAAVEASEHARTYAWYPQRAGRADLLAVIARERHASAVDRQLVADVIARSRAANWNVERSRAARAAGRTPGPEGSVAKLSGSDIARRSAKAHGSMAGAAGMLTGPDSLRDGVIAEILVSVPGGSIAGGTDEIQHNIVGERALGLPREPSTDAQLPFREVRTNAPKR